MRGVQWVRFGSRLGEGAVPLAGEAAADDVLLVHHDYLGPVCYTGHLDLALDEHTGLRLS